MWQSGSFNPKEHRPEGDEKALGPLVAQFKPTMDGFVAAPKMITILDENGEPLKAKDEDRRYFEGPWMHKFNGKYYLSYSTGTTHYLCYAEGDNPEGPFTYKGRIMEPVIGWTLRLTANGISSITMPSSPADAITRDALNSQSSTSQKTARSRQFTLTITSKILINKNNAGISKSRCPFFIRKY